CFVRRRRFHPAIVDSEFLKVGENRQRKLAGPAVAPQLVGGGGIVLDVDRRFLGFEKELLGAADPKTVVGGFGHPADFDCVFVNDILIGFGIALDIVHVPAEAFEERIDEFLAQLGFVVMAGFVGLGIVLETLDKF